MDRLVLNEAIHEAVFKELLPSAERFIWIATADLKDLHLARPGRKKFDTFLAYFDALIDEGIEIRLVHAKEPGPRVREDFDRDRCVLVGRHSVGPGVQSRRGLNHGG